MIEPKSVIDSIKFIINAIKWFEGQKNKSDENYYNEIIYPLFQNCKIVYENYTSMFREVIRLLEEEKNGVDLAVIYLEKNRFKEQSLRAEIRAFADLLKDKSQVFGESGFFEGIYTLTMGGISLMEAEDKKHVDFGDESKIHPSRHTLLYWVKGMSGGEIPVSQERGFYAERAQEQLDVLVLSWDKITRAHAALKIELLKIA